MNAVIIIMIYILLNHDHGHNTIGGSEVALLIIYLLGSLRRLERVFSCTCARKHTP